MREPVPTKLVAVAAHVQEVGSIQVVRLGMGAGSCLVSGAGFAKFLLDRLPLGRLGRGLLGRGTCPAEFLPWPRGVGQRG